MADSADDRLIELEGRFMHLEKMFDQLNEVVIDQQTEIDRLRRAISALRESLASGSGDADGGDAPPPHY